MDTVNLKYIQIFYQAYRERKTLYGENKMEIKLKRQEVSSHVVFVTLLYVPPPSLDYT